MRLQFVILPAAMDRRPARSLALALCAAAAAGMAAAPDVGAAPAARPNVLIIMADDCTHLDLPAYGGVNAKTPNIDRLAEQGLLFERAYLCEAMCQPCRAELYTGQFPMRNGCAWNHSASRPAAKSLPHHLGALGYRVGIAGKVHVKPDEAFPFQPVGGFDPNCVREPTRPHDLGPLKEFIAGGGGGESGPFCLVVALVEPHVPWVMGDASAYPPKAITLPPNIAATPRTRADFARYLAEITYMDGQVGEIMAALEASGKAGETLVLFTSEQGAQFPGCKWTNWDTGVHTALIARWPGVTAEGQRTKALVHYADVAPTLVEAAGGDPGAPGFDGRSFLPVLRGEKGEHRQFVYGMHNNLPEGPPYPIRSAGDGRFHYIRNLSPGEIYIERHLMGVQGDGRLNNPYWGTWVFTAADNPRTYQLVKRFTVRPPEELYDLAADPYEMNNLAADPAFADAKARLSAELDRWMAEQGDPGAPQDTPEALEASRKGTHLFGPKK